jgi:DNA-binding response OmpR family regulator
MVLHPVDEHLVKLLGILSRCHYKVEWSTDLADAVTLLSGSSVPLVICESSLVDGTWVDLMRHVSVLQSPPLIIVTARHANDELWIDVLNRGGYDVLVEPFEAREVARVVSVALDWWHETRQ